MLKKDQDEKRKIHFITQLWDYFDTGNFLETRNLFHDFCTVTMVTSGEIFENIDLYLQMNCDYPGKWRTILERVDIIGQDAVSIVNVYSEQGEGNYYVLSYYTFKAGLIYEMKEYWATVEEQPEWRKKYSKKIL